MDRYLINYKSGAQSPVAGCISAVIVSRKLLQPLTQFRILSLISIEDQHLAVRKGRLARSITRAEPIPLAGCSSIPVMVPSPTILLLFLPLPMYSHCIYVYVPLYSSNRHIIVMHIYSIRTRTEALYIRIAAHILHVYLLIYLYTYVHIYVCIYIYAYIVILYITIYHICALCHLYNVRIEYYTACTCVFRVYIRLYMHVSMCMYLYLAAQRDIRYDCKCKHVCASRCTSSREPIQISMKFTLSFETSSTMR